MKPQTVHLPHEDTPYMCYVEGESSRLAGYGSSAQEAFEDLESMIDWSIEHDYTYHIEDIVTAYLKGWED